MYDPAETVSRFITTDDEKESFFIYELPEAWWSRHYEYAWASKFIANTDVVLDAACGVCHPFKFYLGIMARKAYACDIDPRILSRFDIMKDIKDSIGDKVHDEFNHSLFHLVRFEQSDMTSLAFAADKMFDKVFCISVLGHVNEQQQLQTLQQFSRVLKDDGLIVLTVDYPNVNMESFKLVMAKVGLTFYGESDFAIPDNAISTRMWGPELKCIRLLLRKNKPKS